MTSFPEAPVFSVFWNYESFQSFPTNPVFFITLINVLNQRFYYSFFNSSIHFETEREEWLPQAVPLIYSSHAASMKRRARLKDAKPNLKSPNYDHDWKQKKTSIWRSLVSRWRSEQQNRNFYLHLRQKSFRFAELRVYWIQNLWHYWPWFSPEPVLQLIKLVISVASAFCMCGQPQATEVNSATGKGKRLACVRHVQHLKK